MHHQMHLQFLAWKKCNQFFLLSADKRNSEIDLYHLDVKMHKYLLFSWIHVLLSWTLVAGESSFLFVSKRLCFLTGNSITQFYTAESDTDSKCLEWMPQSGCTQRGQVPIIITANLYNTFIILNSLYNLVPLLTDTLHNNSMAEHK